MTALEDRVNRRTPRDQLAPPHPGQRLGEGALGLGERGQRELDDVVVELDDRGATVRRRELFTS
ncbi:MAG: hypothetical protein ABI591_15850 [Kofleriaceae bacterium]